jgi:hypothetical protein
MPGRFFDPLTAYSQLSAFIAPLIATPTARQWTSWINPDRSCAPVHWLP